MNISYWKGPLLFTCDRYYRSGNWGNSFRREEKISSAFLFVRFNDGRRLSNIRMLSFSKLLKILSFVYEFSPVHYFPSTISINKTARSLKAKKNELVVQLIEPLLISAGGFFNSNSSSTTSFYIFIIEWAEFLNWKGFDISLNLLTISSFYQVWLPITSI